MQSTDWTTWADLLIPPLRSIDKAGGKKWMNPKNESRAITIVVYGGTITSAVATRMGYGRSWGDEENIRIAGAVDTKHSGSARTFEPDEILEIIKTWRCRMAGLWQGGRLYPCNYPIGTAGAGSGPVWEQPRWPSHELVINEGLSTSYSSMYLAN